MNNLVFLENIIENTASFIWGWPLVLFIVFAGTILSFIFSFTQVTKFFYGWKYLFEKDDSTKPTSGESISQLQAFINALSASLGNGGLAGMATVLVDGGPGTAFWVFILGFIGMILRFAEVYAGLIIKSSNSKLFGPLKYINNLPFGSFFVYLYSIVILIYIISAGISMQTNSIGLSVAKITSWNTYFIAFLFSILMLYIIMGGSKRIMRLSEYIIPVKVVLFFIGIIALFVYHYDKIGYTLELVLANAFNIKSFGRGVAAFSIQRAITIGFSRALNATEAGVGTASIFFGSAESKNPIKTSIMSMITAFISTNLVCAALIFGIVLSGVSLDGLTSTKLVIAAFETVFGKFAASGITFLSLSFGLGVMVGYTFLGMKIWEFLFNKKTLWIYYSILPIAAFFGTVSSISLIWKSIDLLAGILIFINVLGILWNAKLLRKNFIKDTKI